VIRGGRVIDPATGVDEPRSVVISQGLVDALLPPNEVVSASQTIDASDCIVTPGWIDFHAHFFPGVEFGFDPDQFYPTVGVTAACDAGTTGAANFGGFRRWVLDPSSLTLRAFLHLSVLGIANLRRMPDLAVLELVDEAALLRVLDENRDRLLGVKLRYEAGQLGPFGQDALPLVARLARQAGLPMAVHVTGAPSPMPQCLEHFGPGDILMHPFHAKGPNRLLDPAGQVHAEVWAARERGVLFDLGRSVVHFDWAVAEAAAAQNFWPDILSTDLTLGLVNDESVNLPGIVAQFMHLGLSLSHAVERVTVRPAAAMGLAGQIGTLRPGARADVSIWRLTDRPRAVCDRTKTVTRLVHPWLDPVVTVVKGQILHDNRPRGDQDP